MDFCSSPGLEIAIAISGLVPNLMGNHKQKENLMWPTLDYFCYSSHRHRGSHNSD